MNSKKVLAAAGAAALAAAGCAGSAAEKGDPGVEMIGMPSPASVWCVDHRHGKLVIRKDAAGNEYGVCILPDGREVEEWELYRADMKAGKGAPRKP